MEYAIETFNLTKVFERKSKASSGGLSRFWRRVKPKKEKIRAVDHVNIGIKEGELFGLLGPNGAGKTTTIRLLCTLLIPDEGTAVVNGFDIIKEAEKVRASVGVVTGGERGLYWRLTGRENLLFFARLYNVPEGIARKRIQELLELVELQDRADDPVEKYSRGMKQRLHVVRGLVHAPPILLLDEPTLGLDPASARVIREFIKEKLQREQGKTILLTTHYMEEANQLCDRIGIMDYGKIIALGTPDELKEHIAKIEVLKISASNVKEDVENRLGGIGRIKDATVRIIDSVAGEAEITIHADDVEDVLPKVIQELVRMRVEIRVIEEKKPTLEDVFISLTGRKLRD
jgi:ABC-2 type transport system ATP-binding protein